MNLPTHLTEADLAQPGMALGIVLLAHGSRDPLWKQPIEAVAAQMKRVSPSIAVRCAYLEATAPDLASSVTELAGLGVRAIRVVPLFLGMGKHTREDLPRLLASVRADNPQIAFDLRPALGEEQQVIELIANIAVS